MMLISLSEVSSTRDKKLDIEVPIETKSFDYGGITYNYKDLKSVNLTISNAGKKKVLIEWKTLITLELFCDRCLDKVLYPIMIDMSKEIDFNLSEVDRIKELDETSYIIDYDLDVDGLVYNEVLLEFPMKVLCNDDCRGICKQCGTKLNKGSCNCDNTEYDPRMLAIRDIFKDFKEV